MPFVCVLEPQGEGELHLIQLCYQAATSLVYDM